MRALDTTFRFSIAMPSDIIDTVLALSHSSDFSAEQSHKLCEQILSLYDKFQIKNVESKPISAVYMFYGALLILPYTSKLQENGVEAVFTRKTHGGLKILISYKTANPKNLVMKALSIDFDPRSKKIMPFSSILAKDIFRKLQSIRKELTHEIFRQTFRNYEHYAVHRKSDGHTEITVTNVVLNLVENFHEKRIITRGFRKILPNSNTISRIEYNLINMRQRSTDMAKSGAHQMFSTIVDLYQTMAGPAQLSKLEHNFYSFIIGVLELNFAQEYKLEVAAIQDPISKEVIEIGLNIQTEHKQWVSTTHPVICKLVHASDALWEQYVGNEDPMLSAMMDETTRPLYMLDTTAESAILLNINYDRVLGNILKFSKRAFRYNLVQSALSTKTLPIIIPHENFIQLLLEPFRSRSYQLASGAHVKLISHALSSFYDKLWSGKNPEAYSSTFESYILGQLLTANDLEMDGEHIQVFQFRHNEPLISKYVATVCLTAGKKSAAVVFNMIQIKNNNFNTFKNYLHTHSVVLPPQIMQIVRISVGANDRNGVVFIDTTPTIHLQPNVIMKHLYGQLKPIERLDANAVLSSMVESAESKYTLLDGNHALNKVLESFTSFMVHRKTSNNDIRALLRGFFSRGFVIDYENVPGLFGVIKIDETPVFIAIATVKEGESYSKVARTKLDSIMKEYIRDYISNPLRTTADFICLVHNIGRVEAEYKGIMRMSTYGTSANLMRQCVPEIGDRRRKRNMNEFCKSLFQKDEDIVKNIRRKDEHGGPYLTSDMEDKKIKSEFPIIRTIIESKMAVIPNIRNYLPKLAKFSGALMTGIIFKDMIGALIREDYKDFAINAAFLASGPLIESLSMRVTAFGSKLVMSGEAFLGKTLLVTMPFLSRLPMQGFIAYDLVQQVDRYKSGDKDAKVNIIGDSTILATEFVTASIDGAAALGYLTTAAEFTGPIGMAIGTAIFIGVDIYSAVKTVSKIESLVHLTGWERFTSGLLSFIHVGPTSKVHNLMVEKQIADASATNALKFFKEHPYIKNYVFPKYKFQGQDLQFMSHNYANLNIVEEKWNRVWPVNLPRLKLTCSPYSFKTKLIQHSMKTSKVLHECQDMFGYENLNATKLDTTVILLEDGNDTLECAPSQNTIIIGNGFKTIIGNKYIDTFVLQGDLTNGIFKGMGGEDILNLNSYALNRGLKIELKSKSGSISNREDVMEIQLRQIYNLMGRSSMFDSVTCDCNTRFLDTKGGTVAKPDEITISDSPNCTFEMQINLQGYIDIINAAKNGTFNYIVQNQNASLLNIKFENNSQANHFFTVLDCSIEQLENFEFSRNKNHSHEYDILMYLNKDRKLRSSNSNENTVFHLANSTEVRIMKDILQIFTADLNSIEEIIGKYYELAHRLGAVVHVHATTQNASVLFGCGKASYYNDTTEDVNHINMLPSDPNTYSYLVGCKDNQNIYRISVPDLHNLAQNSVNNVSVIEPMKPVTLININDKLQEVPNVIDLYELILLMKLKNLQVSYNFSTNHLENSEVLMEVFYKADYDQNYSPLVNITLKNVDFDHSIVINLRRPMGISYNMHGQVTLTPKPISKYNSSYISINIFEIEPYTEIVSWKTLGADYDTFLMQNNSLFLTNAQYIEREDDIVVVYLKNFFIEEEMQTLTLTFSDQTIKLENEVDYLSESEVLEDVMDVDFSNLTSSTFWQ